MVFSSPVFLFLFLPLFLAAYAASPVRLRNLTALAGSLLFYSWGAPQVVGLLLLTSLVDYTLSRVMSREGAGEARRRWALVAAITLNLGLLAYFKYVGFFAREAGRLLGCEAPSWTDIALPIGISFFTFQKISYVVDVYRGRCLPASRFTDYALYVSLFPQLVAGPIVRYEDVAEQLRSREERRAQVIEGAFRFCLGLAKKVLIADPLARPADAVFGLDPAQLTCGYAWVGILAYTFQIYFDFSGYSDMAIGLGHMLGFTFRENFDQPYTSRSITEFWRRWHISLSTFMREYLYIPLGGNKVSPARCYLNLWIVFLLSGLWHGAAWTFVLWGAYHGLFLSLDKMGWLRLSQRLPALITTASTFLIVMGGWVLFRAPSAEAAAAYAARLLGVPADDPQVARLLWGDLLSNRTALVLCLATAISFAPALTPAAWRERVAASLAGADAERLGTLKLAVALPMFLLATLALVGTSYHPFIYFRF